MRPIAVRPRLWAAVAAASFPAVAPAANWNAVSGNWNVASNWNPANVPDTAAETASIGSGTATLTTSYTIGSLVMTGGTVTGPFALTMASLGWYGSGTMSGAGTTTVTGSATLSASTPNTSLIVGSGRTLRLQGDTTLSSGTAGYGLLLSGGATLQNQDDLTITTDASINVGGGNNTFINTGVIKKSGGTGNSTINALSNNDILTVQSGSVQAYLKGGSSSNGAFNATSGNYLNLVAESGSHTLESAAFSGDGLILLAAGTFLTTGTVTSTCTDLRLSGATLQGVYSLNQLRWETGGIGGSGTNVTITGPATFSSASGASNTLNGGTLNLQGTTQIAGTGGGLLVTGNGTVNNSGTVQLTSNLGISYGPGTNTFNNSGTLAKTGGTGTSVVYGLVNSGTVAVQSGVLQTYLKNASTTAGAFTTAGGTSLVLLTDAASHTFGPNVTVGGQGTFRFPAQSFTLQGTVLANGPTFDVSDISGVTYDVVVSGKVVNGTGATATSGLTKRGPGVLYLTGANTYTGPTTVAAGTLAAIDGGYATLLTSAGGVSLNSTGAALVLISAGVASPIAQVRADLAAGRASNFATGRFRSSVTNNDVGLGYAVNGAFLSLKPALYGDADLNGTVNFADFVALQSNFGLTTAARWDQGNFNYDNAVNFADFVALQSHFGQNLSGAFRPATAAERAAMNAFAAAYGVPEPAGLCVLAAGGLLAGRRRR